MNELDIIIELYEHGKYESMVSYYQSLSSIDKRNVLDGLSILDSNGIMCTLLEYITV